MNQWKKFIGLLMTGVLSFAILGGIPNINPTKTINKPPHKIIIVPTKPPVKGIPVPVDPRKKA